MLSTRSTVYGIFVVHQTPEKRTRMRRYSVYKLLICSTLKHRGSTLEITRITRVCIRKLLALYKEVEMPYFGSLRESRISYIHISPLRSTHRQEIRNFSLLGWPLMASTRFQLAQMSQVSLMGGPHPLLVYLLISNDFSNVFLSTFRFACF